MTTIKPHTKKATRKQIMVAVCASIIIKTILWPSVVIEYIIQIIKHIKNTEVTK
jgi:hypothetical protein